MGPYLISLYALALLALWLAFHHGWIAWRRRDLPAQGAFATLAALVAGVGVTDALMQTTRVGDAAMAYQVNWGFLLGAMGALPWFIHRFTGIGPRWAVRSAACWGRWWGSAPCGCSGPMASCPVRWLGSASSPPPGVRR